MPSRERAADAAKVIIHEHRELGDAVASVVSSATKTASTCEEARNLRAGIEQLRVYLSRHFELEEAAGLFEDILERFPASRRFVRTLRRQHREFLARLDAMIVRLDESAEARLESVRDDFDGFLEEYRQHEAAEDDVLHRAYCADLATALAD